MSPADSHLGLVVAACTYARLSPEHQLLYNALHQLGVEYMQKYDTFEDADRADDNVRLATPYCAI